MRLTLTRVIMLMLLRSAQCVNKQCFLVFSPFILHFMMIIICPIVFTSHSAAPEWPKLAPSSPLHIYYVKESSLLIKIDAGCPLMKSS